MFDKAESGPARRSEAVSSADPLGAFPGKASRFAALSQDATTLIRGLGYHTATMIYRLQVPGSAYPTQVLTSNWDLAWYRRYLDRAYLRLDPFVAQMVMTHKPFAWDELTALTPAQKVFREDAAKYGHVSGLSGAVRFGGEQAAFFILTSQDRLTPDQVEHAKARMMLFCAQSFEAVRDRELLAMDVGTIRLTPRQLDVLRSASYGWSRVRTAQALGISVRAVDKHSEFARMKLGASTLQLAVRKASAMNLLESAPSSPASLFSALLAEPAPE